MRGEKELSLFMAKMFKKIKDITLCTGLAGGVRKV